jgi:hypothetical protein
MSVTLRFAISGSANSTWPRAKRPTVRFSAFGLYEACDRNDSLTCPSPGAQLSAALLNISRQNCCSDTATRRLCAFDMCYRIGCRSAETRLTTTFHSDRSIGGPSVSCSTRCFPACRRSTPRTRTRCTKRQSCFSLPYAAHVRFNLFYSSAWSASAHTDLVRPAPLWRRDLARRPLAPHRPLDPRPSAAVGSHRRRVDQVAPVLCQAHRL